MANERNTNPADKLAGVVLAAGESTRAGGLKQLLKIGELTLIEHQIVTLSRAGIYPIIIVLGHRSKEIASVISGFKDVFVVVNDRYKTGKTSSIKKGISAVPDTAKGVLIISVDQPRTQAILNKLSKRHRESGNLISAPMHQGKSGHPIIFSTTLKSELLEINENDYGLRQVLKRHEGSVCNVEFDSPVINLDINTMQQYEIAKDLFAESL